MPRSIPRAPFDLVRSVRGATCLVLVAFAAGSSLGCIVEQDDTPRGPARVEFGEVINLGYTCGGPLASWTVKNRESGAEATAGCEQPILFPDLEPHTTYTFDIGGEAKDGRVCWSGSCQILTGGPGSTLHPDCSQFISASCGF